MLIIFISVNVSIISAQQPFILSLGDLAVILIMYLYDIFDHAHYGPLRITFNMKYLNIYWMDSHKMWYRQSWSPEDDYK